jgi:hypothetical protein
MLKKAEAEALERKVRQTIRGLKADQDELEEAVREGRKVRAGIQRADQGQFCSCDHRSGGLCAVAVGEDA